MYKAVMKINFKTGGGLMKMFKDQFKRKTVEPSMDEIEQL